MKTWKIIYSSSLFAIVLIGVLALYSYGAGNTASSFTFLALLPSVMLVALLSKYEDLIAPPAFTLISVFLGISAQALFIHFQTNPYSRALLIRGLDMDAFMIPMLMILLGFVFYFVGYVYGNFTVRLPAYWNKHSIVIWEEKKVLIISLLLFLLSLIGFILFAKKFSNLSLNLISLLSKKFIEDSQTGVRLSFGYLTWMASLVSNSYYLVLIYYLSHRQNITKNKFFWRIYLTLLGFSSILFPLFTNTRASLLYVFIISTVIFARYTKLKILRMFLILLAMISLFTIMTVQRSENKSEDISEIGSAVKIETIAEGLVGRRSLFSVFKTSHIFMAIPDKLEYEYGNTYMAVFFVPIPRTMWAEKPLLSNGVIIADKVFGIDTAGVPPGMFGELYWNFGWIGITIGLFLFGMIVRSFYATFGLNNNTNAFLIYANLVLYISFFIFSVNVGQTLVKLVINSLPCVIASLYITKRIR